MAQSLTIAPAGLYTDPNPLSAAPDGAMTEALNVIIARPGVVEPRPGLQSVGTDLGTYPAGFIIRSLAFNAGTALLVAYSQAASLYRVYYNGSLLSGAGDFLTSGITLSDPVSPRPVFYAGNAYFVMKAGVLRFDVDSTSYYRAGLPRPWQANVTSTAGSGTTQPLTANTAVAYRTCYTRESGLLKFRSPPSARIAQRSYTGSGAKPVTMGWGANPIEYTAEIYRSNALATAYTSEPSDEMVMIGTATTSSTSFTDDTAFTGLLGRSLYTNATQENAQHENGITPLCKDIAIFRDMMFFANAKWAPSLTFEVLGFGADWRGSSASTIDRLTSFTITATTTNTSTTVSGVSASDIAKVRAGQRVYLDTGTPTGSDANFPIGTYVSSVNAGAGTFVISNAATASTVGATVRLSDWIEVSYVDTSGTTTQRVFCDDTDGTLYVNSSEFSASTTANVRGAQRMAYELSIRLRDEVVVSAFGDGATSPWTFIVESYPHDISSLTVKVSNPDAVSTRIDSTTGTTVSSSDARDGVLAWSKPSEPEHVPPGYNDQVCPGPIERIIAGRDSLFAFSTRDGVYRVSGYSPDTLQIDEYDRSLRLIHPNAACECNGRIAAWTNRGVVLIDESGVAEIGKPISNLLEEAAAYADGHTTGAGVFVSWWPDRAMLLVGVPSSTSSAATHVYVWHERTNAWTRWTSSYDITCAAAYEGTLYFGTKAASSGADTVILKSVVESYDVSTSVTVSAVDSAGTGITISGGSGWTPAVGDILRQSSVDYAVTAITSSTVFTVHTTGVSAAAATALTRSAMQVEWTVRDGENAGGQKLFREVTAILGSASGLVANDNAYTTDRSQTQSTTTSSLTYTASDVPTTLRTRIPRESRRCGRLEHSMTLKGAKPGWQLHGASYVFEPMSTRFR